MTLKGPENYYKRLEAYKGKDWEYPIHIVSCTSDLNTAFQDVVLGRNSIIIFCDESIQETIACKDIISSIRRLLPEDSRLIIKLIESGKHSKNLASVEDLVEWLLEEKIQRDSLFVSMGGGVVGDLTGFISSIYFRGVDLMHIPTNLLSMCDSAVGGKTAVNTRRHINTVGTYKHPCNTVIYSGFLKTLSSREYAAGLAEVIKISLLESDGELLTALKNIEGGLEGLRKGDKEIASLIKMAVTLKLKFTNDDIMEQSERLFLNLGHTFGHAVESLQDLTTEEYYRHGEAVSLGIVCALMFSKEVYGIDWAEDIVDLLQAYNLPIRLSEDYKKTVGIRDDVELLDKLVKASSSDKKGKAGMLRIVAIDETGCPNLVETSDEEAIKRAFFNILN